MKILQVVRQFHPSVGGIESSVLALCDRLAQRGHLCDVVTLRRTWDDPHPLPPSEVVHGLRIDRIPFVGGRRYFFAPEILRLAGGHTIIHIHAIDFFVDFLAATKWRHRTPFVVTTHGGFFHTGWATPAKRIYFHTMTRLALAQAARVICVSAQDDRLFAPIVPAHKRVTIGNGVEDAFFSVRKSVEPGLLVMVGRIAEHKGIDRVIDLLPRIRQEVRGAHLLVVGPDWKGLRPSLAVRARKVGVADAVEFAGVVDRAALVEHLTRAHVVLAASSYEGFGIAVLEAMASGSLVIGNDIEAHREFVRPDVNGVLADFSDDARAIHAVVEALRLPMGRAMEMGAEARATASRFAWDRVVDQVERVYLGERGWGTRALNTGAGWLDGASGGGAGVTIGDLRFDALDLAQTVAVVGHALACGTQGYVVTPNVDHLVQYRRNPAFLAACDAASLRLADGMPIVWASHLLGHPLPARVAGSDLLPALCQAAAVCGHRVFFLGGAVGVPERAAARLCARFPGLRIAGLHAPPERFAPDEGAAAAAAVAAVNAAKPALLFVGLGAPKQELWVHHHWNRLDITVAVCCGAAIDYAAGVQIRAPLWMQRAGGEWVWRLAREPGRLWRRYLVQDAAFVGIFLKEWWSVRSQAFNKK